MQYRILFQTYAKLNFLLEYRQKSDSEKITHSTNSFCRKSKTSITGDQYLLVDPYTGTGASLPWVMHRITFFRKYNYLIFD